MTHALKTLNTIKDRLQQNGKFFTVTFKKQDGTIRVLNGRFGVHKFVKGGVSSLNDNNWNVYDTKNGYRSIKPESIISVSAGRTHYSFGE